jgi:tRNA A-37 threonylcarbamoyl transferase component Bud32
MQNIDGYKIFAELKRGAGSTIYKAWDFQHNRVVLIKLLPAEAADEPQWREQFLKESKISGRLAHPNLRRIFESGLLEQEPFLILEFVEGPTLFELIKKNKKLPVDICLFIARELARGIAAMHHGKVLHRDIKPQNVFLSLTGDVKLGDLGLAQDSNEGTASVAGTPAYMAPEQVLGQELTPASDLFSFGAVLYEMLTGEPAFADRTLAATLHHVVNWDPVPIPLLRPEAPAELVAACQKLLAKNFAERFGEAHDVVDHLGRLQRRYGLSTTAKQLADFIEAPQAYRPGALQQNMTAGAEAATKRAKTPMMSWGMAAVVSATMFLAGVFYIKVLKDQLEGKTATASRNFVAVPAKPPGPTGYLELQIVPGSVVTIDDEAVGKAPLANPIKLPAGSHKVFIHHPKWGSRALDVQIQPDDTLRQKVDLARE